MISRTCRAHCCSAWALARNLSRSSIPLMCSAHSTRSCTLASPSTPWGGGMTGGGRSASRVSGSPGSHHGLREGSCPGTCSSVGSGGMCSTLRTSSKILSISSVSSSCRCSQSCGHGAVRGPRSTRGDPDPARRGRTPLSPGATRGHRTHQLQQVVELLAEHPKNLLTGESLRKPLRERGGYGQSPPPPPPGQGPLPGRTHLFVGLEVGQDLEKVVPGGGICWHFAEAEQSWLRQVHRQPASGQRGGV